MSLIKNKILNSERNSLNVKSIQSSRLTGTVKDNKNVFDRLVEFLTERYNAMIEELVSPTAAAEIGAEIEGISEKTVQGILEKHERDIGNRYTKNELAAVLGGEVNDLVKSFDMDMNTGVITIRKKDGAVQTWDTPMEKVPASFAFAEEAGSYYLQVTNVDGTVSRTDVTALMNHYSFDHSQDVTFTVTGAGPEKRVTASIRDNSIGLEKFSLTAMSKFEEYVDRAEGWAASAGNAERTSVSAASEAKSYAVGQTGTRAGEATDNAKYYAAQARNSVESAVEKIDATHNAIESTYNSIKKQSASVSDGVRQMLGYKMEAINQVALAKEEVGNAKAEADRAKNEADRAADIVGGDFATRTEVQQKAQESVAAHETDENAHDGRLIFLDDLINGAYDAIYRHQGKCMLTPSTKTLLKKKFWPGNLTLPNGVVLENVYIYSLGTNVLCEEDDIILYAINGDPLSNYTDDERYALSNLRIMYSVEEVPKVWGPPTSFCEVCLVLDEECYNLWPEAGLKVYFTSNEYRYEIDLGY